MNSIAQHLKRPGVRYLLVGGSVYALELLIIVIAQNSGASAVQAVAWSYVIGTAVSFLLQKLVTFSDKRMHHKIVGLQLLATVGLVIFNFGFTLLATKLFENVLPAVVVRTLALATTTIWNFYLYKTRIFKGATEPLVS
jgi:putative flippase GtrA